MIGLATVQSVVQMASIVVSQILLIPENYFHPGGTGGTSTIVRMGALQVTIHSNQMTVNGHVSGIFFQPMRALTISKLTIRIGSSMKEHPEES